MKVFLAPTGLYSRAMVRVAKALAKHKPLTVTTTIDPRAADLAILHVISPDAIVYAATLARTGVRYVVIQYCLGLGHSHSIWHEMWRSAEVVWSYYDLAALTNYSGSNFYHAPLGVDDVFINHQSNSVRRNRVITTGYVSGPFAEPIEEVWTAANRAGIEAIHIGPATVKGMVDYSSNWRAVTPSDTDLAEIYHTSRWVSGMRHVEGFELPAAEGIVCGCLPIVFDQPAMRKWYGNGVEYVEECHGEELVLRLEKIFASKTPKASQTHCRKDAEVFDWKSICDGFWSKIEYKSFAESGVVNA